MSMEATARGGALALVAGLGAAAALIVAGGGVASAGGDDGRRGICPNSLCMFADEDFQGESVTVKKKGISNKIGEQMDDQTSSLVNDRGFASLIYAKEDGRGRAICLESGNSLDYLTGLEFDDAASSTRLTSRKRCFP